MRLLRKLEPLGAASSALKGRLAARWRSLTIFDVISVGVDELRARAAKDLAKWPSAFSLPAEPGTSAAS